MTGVLFGLIIACSTVAVSRYAAPRLSDRANNLTGAAWAMAVLALIVVGGTAVFGGAA